MKRVFSNNSEVCHAWASQSQSEGRSGSIFFRDSQIFSYGEHYLAAKIYTNKSGAKFVLVNEHRYSSSTCKHLWAIRDAVSHMPYINVCSPRDPRRSLEKYHADLAMEYFESFNRNVARNWDTPSNQWKDFEGAVSLFNKACDFFNLKSLKIKLTSLCKKLFIEKRLQMAEAYKAKNTPEALEKKESERKKREERAEKLKTAKLSEALSIWKSGGAMRSDLRQVSPQQLRIKGDNVETTGGAAVAIDDARNLLKSIKLGKAKSGMRVGPYTFNRIEEGRVVIGCHSIMLSEAEILLGDIL